MPGRKLKHRTLGPCEVRSVDKKYFRVMNQGEVSEFALNDFDVYFELDIEASSPDMKPIIELLNKGDISGLQARDLINSYYEKADFDAIVMICDKLKLLNIYDNFIQIKHGKALRYTGAFEKAADVAAEACKSATSSKQRAIAHTQRAAALTDLDKLSEAEAECNEALGEEPDSYYTFNVLGKIHVKNGDYCVADEYFNKALSLGSDSEDNSMKCYCSVIYSYAEQEQEQDSEIEKIIQHIRSHWPEASASNAIKEIERILSSHGKTISKNTGTVVT